MHSPMFTLEVFPPKRNAPVGTIYDTLDGLEGLNPDFISVTYGHGTHSDRTATARIAHVISFEASRGDLVVLDAIHDAHFETEAGPGVYDIHSPRIPSEKEIEDRIYEILDKMDVKKVWINPDCGLKTRGNAETWPSLENLVAAAKAVRAKLDK